MTPAFLFAAYVALVGQLEPVVGSIRGVVVNASNNRTPDPNAQVVLRVQLDGQLAIAAECQSDELGRFAFENIPADPDYVYLPGANRDGVHYPSSRITLGPENPNSFVVLSTHDTLSVDNPLVIRNHDVLIRTDDNSLQVSETLTIDNPSLMTYVGQLDNLHNRQTTLSLSIPSNFRRVTFEKEFYGRHFILFDGRLETEIPWTPGRRELAFTYVIPIVGQEIAWKRVVDLPFEHLHITVQSRTPQKVTCNSAPPSHPADGTVEFEISGRDSAVGQLIQIELERKKLELANYGGFLAIAILLALIGISTVIARSKQNEQIEQQPRKPGYRAKRGG